MPGIVVGVGASVVGGGELEQRTRRQQRWRRQVSFWIWGDSPLEGLRLNENRKVVIYFFFGLVAILEILKG